MAEEVKKISFGFAKSIKKPVLKDTTKPEVKKIELIECFDGQSIKIIGGEEKKDDVLVIPLRGGKTWHDRILNKIDADIYEPKVNKLNTKNIKQEPADDSPGQNGHGPAEDAAADVPEIKKEPEEEKAPLTLEEMAAQELILDSKNEAKQDEIKKEFTLPINEQSDLAGAKESTLDDYEQVPIEQYGLAMLRGMGFKEGAVLGRNPNAKQPKNPEDCLRPRGMGLGADKVQKQNTKPKTKEEEQLKIQIGGYVRILAGKYNHNYGIVEGFDDDASRLIIKLALTGSSVSLLEGLVEPVTKSDYSKNSKVLNASKYEEYKSKSQQSERVSSSDTNRKSRKQDSEEEEEEESSDSDRRRRRRRSKKRRSTSDSEDEHRERKSKKKGKHSERDSSKHASKKSRKKEKDREHTRDRRDRSNSPERRKSSKKHKRSRS